MLSDSLNIIIRQEKASLWLLELRERYLNGKSIFDKRYQIALGQAQAQIKEVKDWIGFLESELPSEIIIEVKKNE